MNTTTLIVTAELLAFIAGTLFAGAALYINVAEHPARLRLDTRSAAQQWAPSYQRATWLQAPLALLSLIAGVIAWLQGAGVGWLIGALLVGAVVPFTFLAVMPTNNKLLDPARNLDAPETRELLVRWGRLHAVRTVLSLAGVVVFAVAIAMTGS